MTIITGWRAIAQTFGVTQSVARGWREQGAPILLLPGGKKETVPAASVPDLWVWLSGRYRPAASSHAAPPSPSPAKKEAPPCRTHPSPLHRNRLCLPISPPLHRPRYAPTVEPRAWCGDTVTAGVASGATPSFRVPTDGKRFGSEGSRALRALVVTAHNFRMEHSIAS